MIQHNIPLTGFETKRLRRDGALIDVSISTAPLFGSPGKIKGVLVILDDITERKRAEAELREREEREHQIQLEAEQAKREFYRGTIFSVTGGKLNLVSYDEINQHLLPNLDEYIIASSESLVTIREAAADMAHKLKISAERTDGLITAVGEAAANAVKHASGGRVLLGYNHETIQVCVQDQGSGMDTLILPKATLMKGFSTKPSLGLGYSLILASVDRVYLATESKGTWVLMELSTQEPVEEYNLDALPNYW
jgi:anti-sigma regulatory factor (Ser/Thr protein kinase)